MNLVLLHAENTNIETRCVTVIHVGAFFVVIFWGSPEEFC